MTELSTRQKIVAIIDIHSLPVESEDGERGRLISMDDVWKIAKEIENLKS